jgi:hypothetical protein
MDRLAEAIADLSPDEQRAADFLESVGLPVVPRQLDIAVASLSPNECLAAGLPNPLRTYNFIWRGLQLSCALQVPCQSTPDTEKYISVDLLPRGTTDCRATIAKMECLQRCPDGCILRKYLRTGLQDVLALYFSLQPAFDCLTRSVLGVFRAKGHCTFALRLIDVLDGYVADQQRFSMVMPEELSWNIVAYLFASLYVSSKRPEHKAGWLLAANAERLLAGPSMLALVLAKRKPRIPIELWAFIHTFV